MTDLEIFCRQIRSRSVENNRAVFILHAQGLIANSISAMRQELDSMVRVVYLLFIDDLSYRNSLIEASVRGEIWRHKGSKQRITDKDMVELANKMQGWVGHLYRVCCAFIHLSNFHDYKDRDPLTLISRQEKRTIIKHLRRYHGGLRQSNPTFDDLIPYLPRVCDKISRHLEDYIKRLEKQHVLSLSVPNW